MPKPSNPRHRLYGDGVHDDTAAIQELLDRGTSCIALPAPTAGYLISRTLNLHSGQELRLDRWTEVKLAPGSNCPMLANDDQVNGNRSIAVRGGIWDGANLDQLPNPQLVVPESELPRPGTGERRLAMPANWPADPVAGRPLAWKQLPPVYHPDRYLGIIFRFVAVDGFEMSGLTLKNPVCFATQFARLSNFTIENITFDFNTGNPSPNNMDGLHFDGCCRNGRIANLKGTCYDDLIALNADDSLCESPCRGPLENFEIDGIFADRCHSAVRLISAGSPIRNILIRNVFGSFYRYAIGLTNRLPEPGRGRGRFDCLTFENLHLAKALPPPADWNRCPDWGLIWGESGSSVGSLKISGFSRREETTATPCVELETDFDVDSLTMDGVSVENRLQQELALLHNDGTIRALQLGWRRMCSAVGAGPVSEITGRGAIQHKIEVDR